MDENLPFRLGDAFHCAKQFLPTGWACSSYQKLPVASAQRLQHHNAAGAAKVEKLWPFNCHAIIVASNQAWPREGVGMFWLVSLDVGASCINVSFPHNSEQYKAKLLSCQLFFLPFSLM
jgi:hypothetical protein